MNTAQEVSITVSIKLINKKLSNGEIMKLSSNAVTFVGKISIDRYRVNQENKD